MNKYIKTDIEQGLKYLKVGIMNALNDIESGEEEEINLGYFIPFSLVRECVEQKGWKDEDKYDTNGWDCDCWYYVSTPSGKTVCIAGNLWYGNCNISVENEND